MHMEHTHTTTTLAERLGIATPVSPLRMKVCSFLRESPAWTGKEPEDWLLALANRRDFRVVVPTGFLPDVVDPGFDRFSNEELATAFLSPSLKDRPQLLRLAAQIISREAVQLDTLLWRTRLERTGRILHALSVQALRVDPGHALWRGLHEALKDERPLLDSLLHWTRLAEPIPSSRLISEGWKLVA